MKVQTFQLEQREEWLRARLGKVTGTRLKDIVMKRGTGRKIGFYELIAERLGIPADSEPPMERGCRLQGEATAKFTELTGKKVNTDVVLWMRDDNESVAISPDGTISETEAIEIKCLASSRHIEAWLTQEIPDEYEYQVLQYFCVNDALQTLYFCFFDPRILAKPFFYITVTRESVAEQVAEMLEYQKKVLEEIEKITLELSNF